MDRINEETHGKQKGSVINYYGSCMDMFQDRLFQFFLIWKKHGRREGFVIMDLVCWIFSCVFWWKEMVATAMSTSDICMRILVMIGQESDIRSDTDKDYETVIVIIVDNANGAPTARTQMFFQRDLTSQQSRHNCVCIYLLIYLSIYLRIYLSAYLILFISLPTCPSTYLHMYLSIDLSIQKELYLSIKTHLRFNQAKPSKPPNGGFRK